VTYLLRGGGGDGGGGGGGGNFSLTSPFHKKAKLPKGQRKERRSPSKKTFKVMSGVYEKKDGALHEQGKRAFTSDPYKKKEKVKRAAGRPDRKERDGNTTATSL